MMLLVSCLFASLFLLPVQHEPMSPPPPKKEGKIFQR
ncbi:hypothetical protein GLYMA_08G135850v4 [Glycine max]|nr:hypothetical protein GLYMA_08G135850v4 [Glycine max]KAH1051086.1 hypothetical protein GYH30_021154 [Glycine max]